MRELLRRLERLEEQIEHRACICSQVPPIECRASRGLDVSYVASEPVGCPVHANAERIVFRIAALDVGL